MPTRAESRLCCALNNSHADISSATSLDSCAKDRTEAPASRFRTRTQYQIAAVATQQLKLARMKHDNNSICDRTHVDGAVENPWKTVWHALCNARRAAEVSGWLRPRPAALQIKSPECCA